jgi:hypothetical protein
VPRRESSPAGQFQSLVPQPHLPTFWAPKDCGGGKFPFFLSFCFASLRWNISPLSFLAAWLGTWIVQSIIVLALRPFSRSWGRKVFSGEAVRLRIGFAPSGVCAFAISLCGLRVGVDIRHLRDVALVK